MDSRILTLFLAICVGAVLGDISGGARPKLPSVPITIPTIPTNPCENCKPGGCLAIDFSDRPGIIKCTACLPGFLPNKDGICEQCACIALFDPVCGTDGKTYGNSCSAGCDGGVDVACEGECPCKDPPPGPSPDPIACPLCAVDPCVGNSCPAFPDAKCRFKFCSCDAEFVVGDTVVDCKKPPPPTVCPPGVDVVNCFVDPCQFATCPAFPDAKCVSNFCGGCNADFFVGRKKVECNPPTVCPPGVPEVNCLVDPCQFATCPAFPDAKCVSNFCGGCNADFFVGGKKVECNKGPCKRRGTACKKGDKCCGGECCTCGSPIARLGWQPPTTGICSKRCFCLGRK